MLKSLTLFALLIGLCTCQVHAQPTALTQQRTGDPAALAIPYTDTLRVLTVFVKFRDDLEPGDMAVNARDWPLFDDPGTLPPFARRLLAPTPTPPFPDSSLTAFFFQQSLGRFTLYGDVYDSVLVSLQPESTYHAPLGGYGYLTAEVLDRIDTYGFDFSRYDQNGDGLLDYLFLVIRRDSQRDAKRFTYTGISCLDAVCGGGISGGRPRETLSYDGIKVDWRSSGSIIMHRTPGNIIPHYYHVRIMAHELGHDLWRPFFNHIPPIYNNDVPFKSNRGNGSSTLGYVMMAGAGGGLDARGDETLSAYERELLGWIDCTVLNAPQSVVVTDLYTTSDCKKITLEGDQSGQVLYVTNRQRIGPFDRRRTGGRTGQFEMGLLRTTGLLVMLADGVYLDVLPADNTLDLAATDAPYQGDLFGPGTNTQLTPWTRPNTNGYTQYPPGFTPSWQALDQIRYTGAPSGTMAFEYVKDFRRQPVIRANSWIGAETQDYAFDAPMIVTNESTLRIATTLSVKNRLRVEPGATVIVEPGAMVLMDPNSVLDLAPGATVQVEGTLVFQGWLKQQPGAVFSRQGQGTIRVASQR